MVRRIYGGVVTDGSQQENCSATFRKGSSTKNWMGRIGGGYTADSFPATLAYCWYGYKTPVVTAGSLSRRSWFSYCEHSCVIVTVEVN